MHRDGTAPPEVGQDETLLVAAHPFREIVRWLNICPAAGTLTAWSMTLGCSVMLATRCRRWACPHCGPRRIAHLTKKVIAAKPNKLVTLTLRPSDFESPRDAYDKSRRSVSKLTAKIRKEVEEWEYLRVLEITKKGFPHYHLVVRGSYLDKDWLAAQWEKLTKAWIVDIRKIKGAHNTAAYITKYLHKQKQIPWTNRRVSWTKRFFPPDEDEPPPKLDLEEVQISGERPDYYAYYKLQNCRLEAVGPDMWKLI